MKSDQDNQDDRLAATAEENPYRGLIVPVEKLAEFTQLTAFERGPLDEQQTSRAHLLAEQLSEQFKAVPLVPTPTLKVPEIKVPEIKVPEIKVPEMTARLKLPGIVAGVKLPQLRKRIPADTDVPPLEATTGHHAAKATSANAETSHPVLRPGIARIVLRDPADVKRRRDILAAAEKKRAAFRRQRW